MALILDYVRFSDVSWRAVDLQNPEECVIAKETEALLEEALRSLTPRERSVLELRIGFSEPSRTYRGIACDAAQPFFYPGMSPERVRQIYMKALRKLRSWFIHQPRLTAGR